MMMTPAARKLALTAHVVSSVGLLGAIAAFLALAVAGLVEQDEGPILAAYLAMASVAGLVIVPLAFAALLTGVIQALGTQWGLFKHYWVLIKLALTAFATIVLLIKLELVGEAARLAAATTLSRPDLRAAGMELAVHAAGGLLILLVPTVLSVFKPAGTISFGSTRTAPR